MLKRLNFFFEFFENNSLIPFYDSLNNKTNDKIIYNEGVTEIKKLNKGICVCVVNMIPSYFDVKINIHNTPYRTFRVRYRTGYIIDLSPYSSVEQYLNSHMGSRHSKNILNRLKRLESCFNIKHKIYFGEIDQIEYRVLFEEFERMIRVRFEQRGEEHVGLKRWDFYKKNAYDLILNKRASLFVIYDDKKPIAISLSYHFDNILDSAITSYDIDYAKFGLGNIAVVQKLDWCFQNNYKRMDMRWGRLRYKRQWCNAIEEYKCDVIYNDLPISRIMAFVVSKIIILKKFLLLHEILPLKVNFKFRDMHKAIGNINKNNGPAYKIEDLDQLPLNEELSALDFNAIEFQFLQNPVRNYQYDNLEHSRDINIYRVINEEMSYIIQGKSKVRKLVF